MKFALKLISIVLVMALIMPCSVFADGVEESAGTYSYYFSSYVTRLAKITDRTIEISFDVIGRNIMDEIGAYSIDLQRSTSGTGGWSTIKTYTPDRYAQMMDYNSGAHGECVNYTGTYGYYYRAYVTFYASNDGGAGYVSAYSNVLKI